MFDSRERLHGQIDGMLDVLRREADGRYAAIVAGSGVAFERFEGDEGDVVYLRHRLRDRARELLRLPEQMDADGPDQDVFDGFEDEAFLVAVLNRQVAVVVTCPDPERSRETLQRPLIALADRLFRYEPRWRLDQAGRGFLFGRPRLDVVVIGRA